MIHEKRIAIYYDIFFAVLQYIAIYYFPYIFSKIQLISQYLSSYLTLRYRIKIVYMYK